MIITLACLMFAHSWWSRTNARLVLLCLAALGLLYELVP